MSQFVAVDASVALKWVLTHSGESDIAQADALLQDAVAADQVFLVPPHFFAEVTNVLYRRIRTNRPDLRLTPSQAADALNTLRGVGIGIGSPPDLYERALEAAQRYNLAGAYDALYLVVAERAECDLWTDDQRLLKAVSGSVAYVRWIHDYSSDAVGRDQP